MGVLLLQSSGSCATLYIELREYIFVVLHLLAALWNLKSGAVYLFRHLGTPLNSTNQLFRMVYSDVDIRISLLSY